MKGIQSHDGDLVPRIQALEMSMERLIHMQEEQTALLRAFLHSSSCSAPNVALIQNEQDRKDMGDNSHRMKRRRVDDLDKYTGRARYSL